MDIEVARTFLEIVRTRSFVAAAERLCVTQTTVSARIKGLEAQLDCQLLVRNRTGATLTPAGDRFLPVATRIVQAWDYAKEKIAVPEGPSHQLAVGCELSLWDPLLISWLVWMDKVRSQVALLAEVEPANLLLQKVERGTMDIAVVHSPAYLPGLQVELLMEEKLVLVTTDPDSEPDVDGYVRVGWSADFLARHDTAFPDRHHNRLFVGHGPLALQYLLRAGGSGYFRTRAIEPYLADGRLRRVAQAPEFTYPVFCVHRGDADPTVQTALLDLAQVVKQLDGSEPRGRANS
ncbi:MAG: LysR family transcriptional regulator [Pseudomonadota bacterium]